MSKEELLKLITATEDQDSVYGSKSELWENIFESRTGGASYVDILNPLSTGAIGLGPSRSLTEFEYSAEYKKRVQRYRHYVSPSDLHDFPDLLLQGSKRSTWSGYRSSVLYLKNMQLAKLIQNIQLQLRERSESLRILEIGSGFGGVAEILLRKGIAENYSIIDLKENLVLAAVYLSDVVKKDGVSFSIDRDQSKVNLILPSQADLITDEFDLVINTASFGEMPSATANAYLKLAGKRLSKRGLVISHNSFDRCDIGVKRFSEYNFAEAGLDVEAIVPQVTPPSALSDQHLVLALSKAKGGASTEVLDFAGFLVGIGLHDDVYSVEWTLGKQLEEIENARSGNSRLSGYVEIARQIALGSVSPDKLSKAQKASLEEVFPWIRSPIAKGYAAKLLGRTIPDQEGVCYLLQEVSQLSLTSIERRFRRLSMLLSK